MQAGVGLLDTNVMPIWIIIALDIVIMLRFSINCSTVICSPTVLFAFMREVSSETYGPGSIFYHICFRSTVLQSFISIYINQKTQKYLVMFYLVLSLSDLTFAIDRQGIDNPFITSGASASLFVQVHRLETCLYLLLD